MATVGSKGMSSRKSSAQDKVEKILEQAGLQASPFDALSLQALQDYLADDDEDGETKHYNNNNNEGSETNELPPLDQVDIYGPEEQTSNSDNKQPSGNVPSTTTPSRKQLSFDNNAIVSPLTMPPGMTPATRKSVGNTTPATKQQQQQHSVEDRMMEQLQLQTSLILDLQRKIEGLSNRVKELEAHGGGLVAGSGRRGMQEDDYASSNLGTFHTNVEARANNNVPPLPRRVPDQAQPQQQPPLQEQRRVVIQRVIAAGRQQGLVGGNNRESRLARFIRIFVERRRRQAPNLEWGLVFKVGIMLAILFSRLGADLEDMPPKFYILAGLLVGGFLFQTGYAQFLYKFFVVENNAYRILILDEDVPLEPPAPQGAANRLQNRGGPGAGAAAGEQQQEDRWFDWRQTFLGGRIAPAGPDDPAHEQLQQIPYIIRVIREILLLLLSFVLSIFPMWHPQVPPPPPPPAPPAPDAQQPNQVVEGNRNEGGPGAVRPPRDPTEAEEDEDDEESSDEE